MNNKLTKIPLINEIKEIHREGIINHCLDLPENLKGSTHNHQNWEGGYFDHINQVMKISKILVKTFVMEPLLTDVLLVAYLHDIEKAHPDLREQYPPEEILSMMNTKYEFNLSENHFNAIKYAHGEGNDYNKNGRVMSKLAAVLHSADVLSSRVFHNFPNCVTWDELFGKQIDAVKDMVIKK